MTPEGSHTKPILVTGAAGAVGSIGRNLTEMLLAKGHKVRALVRRQDKRAEALKSKRSIRGRLSSDTARSILITPRGTSKKRAATFKTSYGLGTKRRLPKNSTIVCSLFIPTASIPDRYGVAPMPPSPPAKRRLDRSTADVKGTTRKWGPSHVLRIRESRRRVVASHIRRLPAGNALSSSAA
jgi:hypothetical protein